MYPFEVTFTRIIEKPYEVKKGKHFLETSRKLIAMYRIEEFELKDNKLTFYNPLMRFRIIFGLMDSIDWGEVEVFETKNQTIGVSYTVSLLRFLVRMIIVTLLLLITTQHLILTMIISIFLAGTGWGYYLLRHQWFLKLMIKWMVKPPENKGKTQPSSLYSSMVIEADF